MKIETQAIPDQIGNWKILAKIGSGSFGCVYSAISKKEQQNNQLTKYNQKQVAIKTELITNVKQMLLLQYKIYKQFQGKQGFPCIIEYAEEQRYSFLVMQKFQQSVDKYAASKFPHQFMPAHTLLQIMLQILKILQQIHQKGYLYRDMKPSNLMIKSPYQQITIIDFGLCKRYMTLNRHISMRNNKKLVGTPVFCSCNTHAGLEQSRRDDLQSWVWTSLYFSLELPWEHIFKKKQLSKQAQYQQIFKIKNQTKWEQVIKDFNQKSNTKIPLCIIKIIEYAQKLQFQEDPDYKYLQNLIKDEYYDMYKTSLIDNTINWEHKVSHHSNIEGNKIKQTKQQQDIESPRKVRKINFKINLKTKPLNSLNLQTNKNEQPITKDNSYHTN